MSDETQSAGISGGALDRMNSWQVFVLVLALGGGGGFMVYADKMPAWMLAVGLAAVLLGVAAVAKLLSALAEIRSHVTQETLAGVSLHRSTTDDAIQVVKSDARQTVMANTAVVTEACGKLHDELETNTSLTRASYEMAKTLPVDTARELQLSTAKQDEADRRAVEAKRGKR